ncbi:AbrB/MazE/SpoVT family DNA-binding domain-containing protein [Candidatus Woesearchaeota archaeon]|nr:AbrB/MazE/SpoVT family DNA-binding domain-containing protein [Candidatus Woesearchaeota archaeon]
MKRKVNRVGTHTLTVSLPSKWAKQQGIKQGDEIEVNEENANLVITPHQNKKAAKNFKIAIKDLFQLDPNFHAKKHMFKMDPSYIDAYLDGVYIYGFDSLEIDLPNIEALSYVQSYVKDHFLGYDLTKIENLKCKIENISEIGDEKFDIMLRQLFLMTKKLLEDFSLDMHNKSLSNLKFHEAQMNHVHHYSNYCLRIIANQMQGPSSYALWSFIIRLLQLYRNFSSCYIGIKKFKPDLKFSKEVLKVLDYTIEMFNLIYLNFYNYKIEHIEKIHHIFYDLQKPLFHDLLGNTQGGETYLWYMLGKAKIMLIYLTQFTIYMNLAEELKDA